MTTDPVPQLDPVTGAPACCGPAVPIFPVGEATGVSSTWSRSLTADAGDAVGTEGKLALKIVSDAGDAVGADSSDPSQIQTLCCPDPIPWSLNGLVTATGVWSPADGTAFGLNYGAPTPTTGVLGWAGTFHASVFGGDATYTTWCASGVWFFKWSGAITSGTIGIDAGSTCNPLKLVGTIGLIFPGSNVIVTVTGPGPASWSGGPAAAVGPGGTFTTPPSWSGGPAAAVGPGGTFTTPPSWSGGPAAAVGPGGTFTHS